MAATPETLVKYTDAVTAKKIIERGCLRWSSPELFRNPWELKMRPDLGFDELTVNKAMLNMATSLIFTRNLPAGNNQHPLYKAIRRWRAEDRFTTEEEAFEALTELLASTPELLHERLKNITDAWSDLVAHARVICLSETHQNIQSWDRYAANHEGVALRFLSDDSTAIANPQPVTYSTVRPQITSLREQVDDMVGLKKAAGTDTFPQKMLLKSKWDAAEKEWRCIKVIGDDDLDCGEDVEDWYCDLAFQTSELRCVYFGFNIDANDRDEIIGLIQKSYSGVSLFQGIQADGVYELSFERITIH